MANRSKRKGYDFEVEIIRELMNDGIPSVRGWGSDGRSLGKSPDVDIVALDSFLIQAKRRRALPAWLRLGTVHAVVIREDRGETFALIRFEDLKKILRNLLDQRLAARVDK